MPMHPTSLGLLPQRPFKGVAIGVITLACTILATKRSPWLQERLRSVYGHGRDDVGNDDRGAVAPVAKPVSASSFTASYTMGPETGDGQGRCFGGELLKLVDIVAGIAARKHAGTHCVTISLDRVIFLTPVHVGDILHLSVSINRAWSSSMEAGVRVMKEDARTGKITYASHAYLTFVARPPPHAIAPDPSFANSLLSHVQSASLAAKPPKFQCPAVIPTTVLEHKRHLLAGRRRGHRILRSSAWQGLLTDFRDQVLAFPAPGSGEDERKVDPRQLEAMQKELVAESYMRGDSEIRVVDDTVIAEIEGHMEPVSIPLAEVKKLLASRGSGAFRRLSVSRSLSYDATASSPAPSPTSPLMDMPSEHFVDIADTVTTSVQIVRPQHCNSVGVLFGGILMRWMEEVSSLSVRKISTAPWSTASVDSMTFRSSAHPGYVVKLRAVVLKVWESSAECYSVATAEDRAGNDVFVADAFFSVVAIDPGSSRPLRGGKLRQVKSSSAQAQGTAIHDMIQMSESRRRERLDDKAILLKVYS